MTLRERQAREYAAEVRAERRTLEERIARYIRWFGIHPARMALFWWMTLEEILHDFEEQFGDAPPT